MCNEYFSLNAFPQVGIQMTYSGPRSIILICLQSLNQTEMLLDYGSVSIFIQFDCFSITVVHIIFFSYFLILLTIVGAIQKSIRPIMYIRWMRLIEPRSGKGDRWGVEILRDIGHLYYYISWSTSSFEIYILKLLLNPGRTFDSHRLMLLQ